MEYTLVICEFLGITVEELVNGEPGINLTPEEQELLEAYRNARPGMKEAARKILDLPKLPQAPELPGKSSGCPTGKEAI